VIARLLAFAVVAFWSLSASAQTFTVGVFPSGTPDRPPMSAALATFPLIIGEDVACDAEVDEVPEPVNPSFLEFTDAERTCVASIQVIWAALPDGVYVVSMLGTDGYGPVSRSFRKVTRSKVCFDGATRYALGEGPAVERYDNTTIAKRAIWLARERELVRVGFDVKTLLVSTSVYFAITCR
jgi:hypothetical protein